MSPDVIEVVANEDYTLTLTFENGEIKVFDIKPYLDKGIFNELKDMSYYKNVKIIDGTVSWNDRQDICPDTLYSDSIELKST